MLDRTLDQQSIQERLRPTLEVFEEVVIPDKVELLPNNAYSLHYAWMYSFEKRLKYRIEKILRTKFSRPLESTLFGPDGVVSEGLSNAFAHGHKKKTDLPIRVRVTVSSDGLGFTIQDQGPGFDVEELCAKYQSGKQYFHIAGNGLTSILSSEKVLAAYQNNGTKLCLLYPFNNRE